MFSTQSGHSSVSTSSSLALALPRLLYLKCWYGTAKLDLCNDFDDIEEEEEEKKKILVKLIQYPALVFRHRLLRIELLLQLSLHKSPMRLVWQ